MPNYNYSGYFTPPTYHPNESGLGSTTANIEIPQSDLPDPDEDIDEETFNARMSGMFMEFVREQITTRRQGERIRQSPLKQGVVEHEGEEGSFKWK